jgi:hypothetical protein
VCITVPLSLFVIVKRQKQALLCADPHSLMAEPPPHKSTCTAPLLAVSAGCGENVWQAVLGTKDRWSLMGVSKSTQALFSPAVESLSYKLKQEEKDVQRPIPPILKDVQPRRLKIWGLSKKKQEEEGDDGSTYSKSLHAVSTAPHWSRLRCLVIQRVGTRQCCPDCFA